MLDLSTVPLILKDTSSRRSRSNPESRGIESGIISFAFLGWATAMTSAPPNASLSGGKSLNTSSSSSSSHLPAQQHQTQATTPSFESSSKRAGSSSGPVRGSARNNQGYRKQHKNSRRSRPADEDAMAESVRMLHDLRDMD